MVEDLELTKVLEIIDKISYLFRRSKMKKRINKKASVFLVASVLSFSFATVASIVSATTAHPAPYPIMDVWGSMV